MKIKICGITNLADARYSAAAGADWLGFIQFEASPRYVDPKTAGEIIEWVYGAESVGVFVDADPDTVNRIAETVGFDRVQLHGHESVAYCERIDRPVVKAFAVHPGETAADLASRMAPYRRVVTHFLLDTHDDRVRGGSGRTFDWELARSLSRDFPLFLAGGLSPENVSLAVRTADPVGIDVSSGLESDPGKKDFAKIDAFVEALRSGDRNREA